jgi:hypothetical protein
VARLHPSRRSSRLIVAILVATSAGLVAASPARAASYCDTPPGPFDDGEGRAQRPYPVTLRSGPYAACSVVQGVPADVVLWEQCWYSNVYGNFWLYVRVADTDTYGWVWQGQVGAPIYDDNNDGTFDELGCTAAAR